MAFGVGQALISAVVLAGNLVGKLLFQMAGETPLLLSAVCGAGVLALFFMVVARAAQVGADEGEEAEGDAEKMEEVEEAERGAKKRTGSDGGSLPAPPNLLLRRVRALACWTKRKKRILLPLLPGPWG